MTPAAATSIFKPFNPLPLLPSALSLPPVLHIYAFPVLLAQFPLAVVAATIRPGKCALAFFLVVFVLANIFSSIDPGEHTPPLHFTSDPLTVVDAAVCPCVFTKAVQVVLEEFAFVAALVSPDELSFSRLFAIFVFTGIHGSIRPFLNALTVLLVKPPLTLVPIAVVVLIDPVSVGFVVFPHALVHITFGMDESTESILLAVFPETIVPRAIGPYLNAPSAWNV